MQFFRRRSAVAAAAAWGVIALAGCSGPGTEEGAAGASGASGFDVAKALESADRDPYSAVMTTRSEADGAVALEMRGRINFNAPATGTLTMTVSPGTPRESGVEQVITGRGTYTRVVEGAGAGQGWKKAPVTNPAEAARVPDMTRYAQLLLSRGPSARKGQVTKDGVVAQHLSGEITKAELRTIDPSVHDTVKNTDGDGFRTDVWVDRRGRIVRLEQWFSLPEPGSEKKTAFHQATRFSDFAEPVEVRAPEGV